MKNLKTLAIVTLFALTGCVANNSNDSTDIDPLLDDFRFVYNENYNDLPAVIETMDGLDVDTKIRLLEGIRDTEPNTERRDVLAIIIDGYKLDR